MNQEPNSTCTLWTISTNLEEPGSLFYLDDTAAYLGADVV
jgi:hypothetical protein